jgi:hypothetical protein
VKTATTWEGEYWLYNNASGGFYPSLSDRQIFTEENR